MSTSCFRLNHESSPDDSASLGAMGFLVRKLDELLQTEDGKQKSIIKKFRDDVVDSIYTKMEKLSEVHDPPLTVNYWMKDARELSYDMADFFNELVVDTHGAEVKVDQILEFEELVKDAIELYDCYNLENFVYHDSESPVLRPRHGRVYDEEHEHVGVDNRIKELRSLVMPKGDDEEGRQLKVVSILGVDQGVGKSTLAQKLWRESETEFGTCRAFVLMARKPDLRMTLGSILSQIRPLEAPGDYTVPYLIHDIRTHLQDKRYFIVIDDLWAISVWDIVRRAFPDSKNCSRIVITTTVEEVAHACCSNRNDIFHVKPLSDKQTNELFIGRVFGPGKECPQHLNVDSDEISRKCGGLPLAIVCTATLLASHLETKQKLGIEKMEQKLDYVKNFLDNNLRTRPASVEILNQVLKLCYSSLPHYLKTCLLYLSMYPENYLIVKGDLVKQWIAEGFILVEGKSIVKTAGSYFDVLVSLGLIQQIDIDCSKKEHCKVKEEGKDDDDHEEYEGQVVEVEDQEEEEPLVYSNRMSYVVHPKVYEFVTSKCIEDNFITIIDYSQSQVVLTERIHRLSLHFGSATYATTPTSIMLPRVQSIAFMGLLNCMPSLVEFKVVRVMILHIQSDDRDKRFSLAEIGELHLLRYLQVRCNVTVELPVQVQCLKHLETLEINAGVADVPTDIVHHSRLQHVRIGRKIKHNLAQGPAICTEPIFPKDLSSKPLSAVQVFELLPPICSFSWIPGWTGLLTSLRILEVVVRELRKYDLDHLGKLPVLTILSLYVRKPDSGVITFHRDALFPALECFKLVSSVLLLSFPEKAMPKLRTLKIRFNARRGEKYSDMLHGIQHLAKLKEVVGRIGVATDAEESDMTAAELAYEEAISNHPSGISPNVKRVGKVEEEYETPDSSNMHDKEVLYEIQNEDPKQAHIQRKLPQEDCTHNIPRGNKNFVATPVQLSTAAWRQSDNKVWRRTEQGRLDSYVLSILAVVSMLSKLRALQLQAEHMLFSSVRADIQLLCDELEIMIRPSHILFEEKNQAWQWFNHYCELTYDIEDWADRFTLSIPIVLMSMVAWVSYCYLDVEKLPATIVISNVLRDFRVRVCELRQKYGQGIYAVLRPLPFQPQPQDILLHNGPSSLVGHNKPMEEVIKMLMNSRDMDGFKIISITGMFGSGKTMLATAVYQWVTKQFDCCAFVYMGQQCDMVKTLEGICRQLEMKDQESIDIDDLTWKLRTFLEDKRYLIMVDDLWSKEHWEIMRHCFPENDLGSRIIITTTNDALALWCSVGSSDCLYKIGFLSDADSEQLFVNKVFGKGQGFHQHFNVNSAEIMEKCGGLPLAIVRAATLAQRQSVHEWKRVGLKSLVSSSDENYMWQRLNVSYNDLPNILKTCMLYLSIFPEYYEVDVERLMRLWIAEGFIIQVSDRAMEETARSYLDGLISRNMVLPLHVNHHGIPRCCMVHPVIHDFIVYKSREEKIIAIVNDQHGDIANNYGTIRRLSVQSNSSQEEKLAQNSSTDISQLRSIIGIGQASTAPQLTDPSVLRVLDLESCEGTPVFLEVLHKLQLLRYLNLRGTNVSELPDTIGQLCFLQTLDVRSTNIKELPPSIVMLKKLMHLLCGSTKLPQGISEMKELQTLSCAITTESWTSIKDLSELVDLRELELFCDFTQMPRDEKQATFSHGGFGRLKKLCVRCNSASVAFEPNALTMVEVLELSFEGPLLNESSGVSGIDHLLNLKHVLLEFSQDDAGTIATVDAARKAATALPCNNPEVTVNVDAR